jgi:RND family efflux transporter MFP subunit
MKAHLWVVVGAVGIIAAACGGEGKAEESKAVAPAAVVLGASDVAAVERTDLTVGIPVSGTLEPAVDVRIKSPIPEVLEAVLVKEGEAVARGQVLARFRSQQIRTASMSAEAQRRLAVADYERMKNLFQEGAVSQRDVDNAAAAASAAEATAVQAEQRLGDATVRAPVSGVIAERSVEGGDRIKDGDPMFRLVNTSQLEFAASVPSQYIAAVRPGVPVSLSVTGLRGTALGGKVSRVNATADAATRQVKVYVIVPNPKGRLVGGLFASGRIVTRHVANTLVVPQSAVRVADDSTQFVLVIADSQVTRKPVETGAVDDVAGLIEITKGLAAGDIVVVAAAAGLRHGDRVTITGREGGR